MHHSRTSNSLCSAFQLAIWASGLSPMRATPPALRETVVCMGGGITHVLRDVVLPLMLPTVVSTFFFLFVCSMVTRSAVIFLISPKVSVAAVQVMRLDESGLVTQAAAFSVCVMASVLGAMLLMQVVLKLLTTRKKAGFSVGERGCPPTMASPTAEILAHRHFICRCANA